jgi:hypothetical protein
MATAGFVQVNPLELKTGDIVLYQEKEYYLRVICHEGLLYDDLSVLVDDWDVQRKFASYAFVAVSQESITTYPSS